MKTLLQNFRIVDASIDAIGAVILHDEIIRDVWVKGEAIRYDIGRMGIDRVIDGGGLTLMPAFIDMHAHFRDPGFPEKETLESASLAALAGGYTTVICMANTKPVIDTFEAAQALKHRSNALRLIDLYPALALTRSMAGTELASGFSALDLIRTSALKDIALGFSWPGPRYVRLCSEDGKDVADDALFKEALVRAAALRLPVSCHCDAGGHEALQAWEAGQPYSIWSRIEENVATERAIRLGREAGAHVHIAHVSTKEALARIRAAKARGESVSCEVTPHHLCLTESDAASLGSESYGRVNPPLRNEEDRQALIAGLVDGSIDAIATDHAPHTSGDKEHGSPGFSGLETSFAACFTELVGKGHLSLSRLSALMSVAPARLLRLFDRGAIEPGLLADLVVVDTEAVWHVDTALFRSRGKNSAFSGRALSGKTLMTLHAGSVVFDRGFGAKL
ncbi:MAG: dihydroorotase [Treponema sp.]|nr:dihydroorotase [Treponema sp.]